MGADAAGLKTGDIILEFNGEKIGQSSHLPPIVGAVPVGDTVDITVLRNGKLETLPVTIAELAEDRARPLRYDELGMHAPEAALWG